jgi:hypothetical protein
VSPVLVPTHMEHADDIVLVSRSAPGLQRCFTSLFTWCGDNFLAVNPCKSFVMIFGPLPCIVPSFSLGGAPVHLVQEHTYVGVTFCSTHRNIFMSHYLSKAMVAHQCGHAMLAVESLITALPPKEGRILYTARVDPHLINGCEVVLDVDMSALKLLCDVQHKFLRRLLGVNASSPLAPLFTEVGIMPLRFRRIILAIRHLAYLVSLPPTHLTHAVLIDSHIGFNTGIPRVGFFNTLTVPLQTVPFRGTGTYRTVENRTWTVYRNMHGVLRVTQYMVENKIKYKLATCNVHASFRDCHGCIRMHPGIFSRITDQKVRIRINPRISTDIHR